MSGGGYTGLMTAFTRSLCLMLAIAAINLGSLQAAQPHMYAGLDHLRAARAELQRAEHNKGGWRARALDHVERAIADTENGIRSAR
jgi:hypothetical protein